MTDDLVERVAQVMRELPIDSGEGNEYRLFDLLGFSGENQSHIVVNALARAIIPIVLEHAAERAVKAYTAGEYEGEAWDCFGSAEFAIAAAILMEKNDAE